MYTALKVCTDFCATLSLLSSKEWANKGVGLRVELWESPWEVCFHTESQSTCTHHLLQRTAATEPTLSPVSNMHTIQLGSNTHSAAQSTMPDAMPRLMPGRTEWMFLPSGVQAELSTTQPQTCRKVSFIFRTNSRSFEGTFNRKTKQNRVRPQWLKSQPVWWALNKR